MKSIKLLSLTAAIAMVGVSCKKEDTNPGNSGGVVTQSYKVTIENVSQDKSFFASGVFNTPVGESAPGPATPGNSYAFDFHAPEGSKLSFATMQVNTNDLFFAPDGMGIALYDANGNALTGDVTAQVDLWDAGTEVNEMPGSGPNQPMNQAGPNTGPAENGNVQRISNVNDGFTYPSATSAIKATLTYNGGGMFNLEIENLVSNPAPLAPGVWVVHTTNNPLFTENMQDMMKGLEALAEDGNPAMLADYLTMNSGIATPFAPGVWAVHSSGRVLFEQGVADFGEGLEALAEDGGTDDLEAALANKMGVKSSGVFNTPVGSGSAGPLMPGQSYEFTFTASTGDYLSFATMFVQSNDLFLAPGDRGIALFSDPNGIEGDISNEIMLWDAGTEANEYPGVGPNQPMRQAGPNTGVDENGNVRLVDDGYIYLDELETVKVTLIKM